MMQKWPLFWLMFYRRRRLVASLAVGLVVFETLIVVITAAIPADQLLSVKGVNAASVPRAFQAFSGSNGKVGLASVAGLLGAGLLHPFWVALQLSAVGSFGAAIAASDIEGGTIELIAVRPVSRLQIFVQRVSALLLTVAFLSIVAVLPLVIGMVLSANIRNHLATAGPLFAALAGFALVLAYAGVAVAVSCAARRRSTVLGAVGGVAAVTYAMNFIAAAWGPADFLKWLSPFHYYRPADALVDGAVSPADFVVLLAMGSAGLIFGAIALRRRDLTR